MIRGKKLYKTSMLPLFRWFLTLLLVLFFHDFYLETFTDPHFIIQGKLGFLDVWIYHYHYPFELITFASFILPPYLYYSFLRGISFYENGILYNKGLPFYNQFIPYSEIQSFKILHPQHILILYTQNEMWVVLNSNLDRILAIVDQQNIKGDFSHHELQNLIKHLKKFLRIIFVFVVVIYLVKKFGWLRITYF